MVKEYLQSLEGMTIYSIISLVMFVVFFAVIIMWTLKVDKKYIIKMENLPLENDEANNFNNTGDLNEKNI